MTRMWTKESADGERNAVKISRDLEFPRQSVFEMFTDPERASKWFGSPEGAVRLAFEWDPRPGGRIRIVDRYEGKVAETSWTILEMVVPERIVFESVTTPEGGTAPWEARQTVILEELSPGRTRVTVLVKVLATGSFPGGVESLEEGYQGGWGETLEMLQGGLR